MVITCSHRYVHRKLTFWQRQGVPTAGLAYQWNFLTQELDSYDMKLVKQLGPVYGTYERLTPILIVADPELIREVLVKEFIKFPNHKPLKIGEPEFDKNLFALEGHDWKRIRSIISPTFTSGKLRGMTPQLNSCIDNLCKQLEFLTEDPCNAIDVFTEFKSLAFDVLLRCAYGVEIDTYREPNHPIAKNLKNLFTASFSFLITITLPKLSKLLRVQEVAFKSFRFFQDLAQQLIMERKKAGPDAIPHNDFLQLMLDANKESLEADSNGKTLSDLEIRAQSIIFLLVGFHTTAVALACAIYHLATNPETQEKLHAEISQLNSHEKTDAIMDLKYLDAFIKESLRLSSPAVRVERQCVAEHQLGTIQVLPGTIISIPVYAIHRDSKNYTNPEAFIPERFLKNGSDVNHHPYAYLPFGGGPRMCVAQRFALMETKFALAQVVQKFHFETTSETQVSLSHICIYACTN